MLAVDNSAGAVRVLNGDGTGRLRRGEGVRVDPKPVQIVAKDFNGDRYPDFGVLYSNAVSVVLSDGIGGYAKPVDYPVGPGPFAAGFTTWDMDGDGHRDLIIANYGPSYQNGWFTILFGRPDGTFEQPDSISAGENPVDVNAGDFNEDGLPDVVVALNNGPQGIQIFLNEGQRVFQQARTYPFDINPRDPEVADLNGDGHLDVAVAGVLGAPYGQAHDVAIFTGRGDGTFDSSTQVFGDQKGGSGVIALTKRGDWTPDLAVENIQYDPTFPSPSVSILSNCS